MKNFFKKIFSSDRKIVVLGGVIFSLIVAFIIAALINIILKNSI